MPTLHHDSARSEPLGIVDLANESIQIRLSGPGRGIRLIRPAALATEFTCTSSDLYLLEITAPNGEKSWIGSSEAVEVVEQFDQNAETQELQLSFVHHLDESSPSSLVVKCRARLNHRAAGSDWEIEVENNSVYALQKIKYPILQVKKRSFDRQAQPFRYLYDRNSDYLSAQLLGLYDGVLIPEPHETIPDGFGWTEEHPGRIGTQLTAYYDVEGGLCLFTKDASGTPKLLGFGRQADSIDLTPTHLFPRLFGASVKPEYAVSLTPFHGDWQTAANLYKNWARSQEWTKVHLSDRQDVPDWLKKGNPFLLYVQSRPGVADHSDQWQASMPRQMLPVLQDYEKRLNSAVVAVIFGWEKHASWITPDVFPPFPGQKEFSELVTGLKENRSHVLLYNSGTRWAVKNPRVPEWDGSEYWEKEGRQASCVAEDEQWSYDSRPWAVNHKMCIAADGTRQLMDHYIQGFNELGIDATQYDQNLGGETYVCFSDQHGHPPGYGRWMIDGNKAMLKHFLEESRKHNPDFAISVEEPNEVLLQHLTLYDSRAMVYHGWPLLTNVPCLGVPMFSYLYHEYAVGFSGDYSIFLKGKEIDQVKMGRIISAGHLMCDFIHPNQHSNKSASTPVEGQTEESPSFRLMKHATAAYQTYAHDFLVSGKMLPFTNYEVDEFFVLTKTTAQSYYGDERVEYVQPGKEDVKIPSVLCTNWMSPQGTPACVIVNMSEKPQKVTLHPSTLSAEFQTGTGIDWVLENLDGKIHYSASGQTGDLLTVVVPPLQVSLLKPSL